MTDKSVAIDGVQIPPFIYGTAWKEERTQQLTELALRAGFRGIDTANQRKHYHEQAVGQAISAAIEAGLVSRGDLFLQSKFTFRRGQDDRLPYDPASPIAKQVEQSFASSLEHLGVERIDSYVLHGPSSSDGLAPDDWAAWRAMEAIHDSNRASMLGVSNVSLDQLKSLCAEARVRPRFVQNRCYAVRGWDRRVREFCAKNDLLYQGFSLLTANRGVLADAELGRIAKQYNNRTPAQIVFRFALDVGIIPLTGTSNADHMRADLEASTICLKPDEVARIERLGER